MWYTILLGTTQASANALLIITIDRYILIQHSFKYDIIVTKTTMYTSIAIGWIIAGMVVVLPLFGIGSKPQFGICQMDTVLTGGYLLTLFFTSYFMPVSIMFLLYWRLAWTAYKHRRQIHALKPSGVSCSINVLTKTTVNINDDNTNFRNDGGDIQKNDVIKDEENGISDGTNETTKDLKNYKDKSSDNNQEKKVEVMADVSNAKAMDESINEENGDIDNSIHEENDTDISNTNSNPNNSYDDGIKMEDEKQDDENKRKINNCIVALDAELQSEEDKRGDKAEGNEIIVNELRSNVNDSNNSDKWKAAKTISILLGYYTLSWLVAFVNICLIGFDKADGNTQ